MSKKSRLSGDYNIGMKNFIDFAFSNMTILDAEGNTTLRCPYVHRNNHFHKPRDVENYLLWKYILQSYYNWIYYGEHFVATSSMSVRNVDQRCMKMFMT